jgi:hypothetical protein
VVGVVPDEADIVGMDPVPVLVGIEIVPAAVAVVVSPAAFSSPQPASSNRRQARLRAGRRKVNRSGRAALVMDSPASALRLPGSG